MNDPDIHALSGAYAVDAVDDLERARFERHLHECASCRDEVASLRESAAHLSESVAVTPPPALRALVLDEIRAVRPLPPEISPAQHAPSVLAAQAPAGQSRPSRSARIRWTRGLVAACMVGAVGLGAVIAESFFEDETTQVVSQADRVLAARAAAERP